MACVIATPAGWAQTIITDQPERETTAAEQAQQAAERAADFRAEDPFRPVTYADVLKDPDNIELSFLFARTQVQNGNLYGAATTLERLVLLNPYLVQVRLFNAVVLYRLEDLDEAEREFTAVAALDITPEVRDQVDAYLERIRLQRKRTRYTASLSLGGHYDSNRNAVPVSDTALFIDIPVVVGDGEDDDFGFLGIGSFRVDHDLGYQERHELFGALTYYHDDQIQQDEFDLQSFNLEGGGIYRDGPWSIIPTAFATHLQLSRETYFREFGVGVRVVRKYDSNISMFVGLHLSDQDFDGIAENSAAPLREGSQLEGMIGATYVLSPAVRISADYLHFEKNAKADFFGYGRDQLRFNHTMLLGEGQFLVTNLKFQRDRYDEADIFISSRTRHDNTFTARTTYGAPLKFFVGPGKLHRELEDVTLSASGEWYRTSSNIPNFDYRNFHFQALLTKTLAYPVITHTHYM